MVRFGVRFDEGFKAWRMVGRQCESGRGSRGSRGSALPARILARTPMSGALSRSGRARPRRLGTVGLRVARVRAGSANARSRALRTPFWPKPRASGLRAGGPALAQGVRHPAYLWKTLVVQAGAPTQVERHVAPCARLTPWGPRAGASVPLRAIGRALSRAVGEGLRSTVASPAARMGGKRLRVASLRLVGHARVGSPPAIIADVAYHSAHATRRQAGQKPADASNCVPLVAVMALVLRVSL